LSRKKKINWFRLNRNLHRDFGYLVIGLTIVFAVSGIALNHVKDWNPNYQVERLTHKMVLNPKQSDAQLNEALLAMFPINMQIKATYWETPKRYKLFFDSGGTLTANFAHEIAIYEKITARPILKKFNTLHLNELKFGWIIFSDIYAGLLIFLAISSLFMVKGKYSPWRMRKGWLVILGCAIPAGYFYLLG